jgi:2-polyprenyl-3-methyl-5-hydroxy-6-metoxy-1,4-benzoquinol methylase
MMKTDLSTLCCPQDKGALTPSADGRLLFCRLCGRTYAYNGFCWVMDGDTPSDNGASAERMRNDINTVSESQQNWGPIRRYCHEFGLVTIAEAHYKWVHPLSRSAVCLDVGCGDGLLLSLLAGEADYSIGVDPLVESLAKAKTKFPEDARVILIKSSGTELPIQDDCIDVVVTSEVLEHVATPHKYLAEIYRVLKPNGVCTLSTPSGWMYYLPMPWNMRKLAKKLLHPHRYYWDVAPELNWAAALPSHPALRFSVLEEWCRQAGFDVLKHRGVLWSYHVPCRFSVERLFEASCKVFPSHIRVFKWLVRLVERGLECDLPFFRMISTRQIILLKKTVAPGVR